MAEEDLEELSELEIERLVERATKFLGALSRNPAIRDILVAGGYGPEEHQRGFELLFEVVGYRPAETFAPEPEQAAHDASAELDGWDDQAFNRTRFALEHHFPEQARYLFANLKPARGFKAVAAVRTFLDRVVALRDGKDPQRAASRAADAEAVKLLERRRILSEAEIARLRELIDQAKRLADAAPPPRIPDPSRRQLVARQLRAFLNDWRETARVLVTRREYQIQLGLAERRRAKGSAMAAAEPDDEDDEDNEPKE
jgi:hypothetical protein